MTTLQNNEGKKGPKKTFAPPAQKLHSLVFESPNSPMEGTSGNVSAEAEGKPNLLVANLQKKEKTSTKNDPSRGREEEGKVQASKPAKNGKTGGIISPRHSANKQAEKKEKIKSSLTDEEFEDIVKIVLQKYCQKHLGGMESSLDFAETACTQSIECTQLDKEPDKEPSTNNGDADREQVVKPHSPELSTSQENVMIPEVKTSASGQPDPSPSEKKKFDKLLLSKKKKKIQNDIMVKVQNEQNNHKDQPKKIVEPHCQIRDQQKGEGSGFDQCLVWVQCSSANCKKWRRLHGDIDPAALPENWSCDQNTDSQYNCCTAPEEIWTGGEGEVAYASYIPGSIIWAKQYGYPWWPGMVESDPDLGEYFLFASHLDSLPSKYHVTFFGETVSRAWIPVSMLKNFQELSWELSGVKKCKNKDCSKKLRTALSMAQEAEKISVRRRINMFGFWSRYSGSDSTEEKEVMLSGNGSPNSLLENEEETLEEEEMEEQIKDTTLPSRKAHKNKTKKSRARGTAHGQGGTLQKKVMKRSLGSDPTAPVPIAGKKEQTRSDPDQPRSKKKFKTPQSKDSQTSLFINKEARHVLKALIPPVHCGAFSMVGTEGSGPQELLPPEHGGVPSGDEVSSDLDLEQLREEPGREPEQKEELQQSDRGDEHPTEESATEE
ncbi:zinc finger CW-type PWWP domain protein 1 [Sorex araneus]|uniref:zinc finger CW-type PWWP domain protein 1 n=1 Tax=Sorex araneus TaxID=42254 RepID=UPI0024340487|nr:zinc finger CW-type PWWP domain protein 1 [Sorex araneus]